MRSKTWNSYVKFQGQLSLPCIAHLYFYHFDLELENYLCNYNLHVLYFWKHMNPIHIPLCQAELAPSAHRKAFKILIVLLVFSGINSTCFCTKLSKNWTWLKFSCVRKEYGKAAIMLCYTFVVIDNLVGHSGSQLLHIQRWNKTRQLSD